MLKVSKKLIEKSMDLSRQLSCKAMMMRQSLAQYEAQFVLGVEGVGHADNKWAVLSGGDQAKHDPFVEGQGLALFHLDAFLVQAFHGVHFPGVGFAATVNLTETTPT